MNKTFIYEINKDNFEAAGEASSAFKNELKKLELSADVIRRAAISMYEAEINMFLHANGGTITAEIDTSKIRILCSDNGPGIKDVDKALTEGFSTADDSIRSLGFGAGMGLPNIKRYADEFKIESEEGVGTRLYITINL